LRVRRVNCSACRALLVARGSRFQGLILFAGSGLDFLALKYSVKIIDKNPLPDWTPPALVMLMFSGVLCIAVWALCRLYWWTVVELREDRAHDNQVSLLHLMYFTLLMCTCIGANVDPSNHRKVVIGGYVMWGVFELVRCLRASP
jgi:hypothetical protein